MQNMVYSTRLADENGVEGVVTYARTANDFDVLTWLDKMVISYRKANSAYFRLSLVIQRLRHSNLSTTIMNLLVKLLGLSANRLSATLAVCLATVFPHATASCSFWNNIMTKVKTCSSMQTAARN